MAIWIGGVATVILAVGAGFTVCFARKAFNAQSQQLKDSRTWTASKPTCSTSKPRHCESLDERTRAADDRRSAQARLVKADAVHSAIRDFTADLRTFKM
jgi:hypothetical protein